VSIWLERFCLAILVGLFLVIVVSNTLKLDGLQRTGIALAIIGMSVFVAQTIHNRAQKQPGTASAQPDGTNKTSLPPKPSQPELPPTMPELFNKDFPNTMKLTDDSIGIQWQDGSVLHVKRQLYLDFPAKTKFVGFYLPRSASSTEVHSERTYHVCMRLVEAVQPVLDDMPKKVMIAGGYRDEMNTIQDLTFSGRVLLYHEDFLSIQQKADILKEYAARHYDVQFRGPDFLGDQVMAWHRQHENRK
jgi:hypothetical protein